MWPIPFHVTLLAFCLTPALARLEFPEEYKEIIQHVHDTCVSKTGTTEKDIANCENGIFKEDQKLKCYMFCLFEEGNFVEDDGTVDYDMMAGMIPEPWTAQVAKMIGACKSQDTPDKERCQSAFDFHSCSYKQAPDLYFLF